MFAYSYNNKTEKYLYNKTFFKWSSLSNLFCHILTAFIISNVFYLEMFVSLIFFGIFVESNFKDYSRNDFNNRYVMKIIFGIFTMLFSVYYSNREYIIYLPILMGLFYLNVNSIIKSKLVHYACLIFIPFPIIKVLFTNLQNKIEYLVVLIMFSTISFMTHYLFSSRKNQIEENEEKVETIKTIFQMRNGLKKHDIRNELTKLMILSSKKYRSDFNLFIETLESIVKTINLSIDDDDIFGEHEVINFDEILDQMPNVTLNKNINFSYGKKDEIKIKCNKNILFSTIKNFLENSMEAARKNQKIAGVVLTKEKNLITIIDDCGGFDLSKISFGNSSKEHKHLHGIFLKTIITPFIKDVFGFSVEIENIGSGTKVKIMFENYENDYENIC